ncbi:UNVERIFIED_CONTAM: hypothetical protein FKN15_025486 [Acipenser sinensis]
MTSFYEDIPLTPLQANCNVIYTAYPALAPESIQQLLGSDLTIYPEGWRRCFPIFNCLYSPQFEKQLTIQAINEVYTSV